MTAFKVHGPLSPSPSPWRWAWGGLLLGILFGTVAWAPAALVSDMVNRLSDGRIRFNHAQGTIWSGSADVIVTGGAGSADSARLPGRVTWRLSPAWSGVLATAQASCCMDAATPIHFAPAWQGGSLTLGALNASFPLAILTGLGTPWNTIQPHGNASVRTQGIQLQWSLGRWSLSGNMSLDTDDLTVRLSTLRPIGKYRVQLVGAEQPRISLETLSGALLLQGQGQWSGGKLRFEGEASTSPDHEEALSNLLNILGRRNGARSIIHLG